ncbi:uncharacterized protein L203_100957 [Cryptococcus depauperatus CBS 7841]|uniref:Uncharacterized protein n=1 Tax=Cryptococcus depauperatus CBS 7841 TaxID=1295531 RepID=A0AAJ8JP41_9TREE
MEMGRRWGVPLDVWPWWIASSYSVANPVQPEIANLSSTPSESAPGLAVALPGSGSLSTPIQHANPTQEHPISVRQATRPVGSADLKVYDPWIAFSSPPSPSTIASTADSQIGGEYFPPSESTEGSSVSNSSCRQNLSLSINSLPSTFQQVQQFQSPTSLASASAQYTDGLSVENLDLGGDYLHFSDAASLSTEAENSFVESNHRLPASQPSSPARNVFPQQFSASQVGGRQRGATFSGSFYHLDQADPSQFTYRQPFPSHIALSSIQNASGSLASSPNISPSPPHLKTLGDANPFFGAAQEISQKAQTPLGGAAVNKISMENMTTPTPVQAQMMTPAREHVMARNSAFAQSTPLHHRQLSNQSRGQQQQTHPKAAEMPNEMVDKLSLLDRILDSAQHAKEALLRGEEFGVLTRLGDLSNHLEIANEFGVGPVQTPKDTGTPNSQRSGQSGQSVSPTTAFQSSPSVQTNMSLGNAQYHQMPMVSGPMGSQVNNVSMTVEPASFLGMEQNGVKRSAMPMSNTVASSNNLANAEYFQGNVQIPPPLVHSHSFPNGHQLPSQLAGTLPSSTPVVPSPSFITSMGVQHMPMVSSPLATMPPSRPPSPPRYNLPTQPWDPGMMPMESSMQLQNIQNATTKAQPQASQNQSVERRPSTAERADGRPIVRGRSSSVNKGWNHNAMTASVPPSAWQSRQGSPVDEEDDESDDEGPRKTKRRRSSVGVEGGTEVNGGISDDIRKQLDQIFEDFLNRICSDLEVCDSKGEKIHQVLMPKKMARLDESTDYRPFKFRIQAFTNAFTENLQQRGITEEIMSIKKIKNYLWKQSLISRFNPDGKKAKSKGNHIWNVDAKKLPGGGWVFRPFQRRFIGQPNNFALVNQRYEWEPRIWDPQAASDTLHPKYSSPPGSLPHWLRWEDGVKLVGMPDRPSAPFQIQVHAEFVDGGGNHAVLDESYPCQAVPHLLPVDASSIGGAANPSQLYSQGFASVPAVSFDYLNHQIPLGLTGNLSQSDLHFANGLVYPQPGNYPGQ